MPVENERKYVLRDPQAVSTLWKDYWLGIDQGYLPGDARIRRVFDRDLGNIEHVFTYKIVAPSGKLIEIETGLSYHDWDELWPMADRRVRKQRQEFHDPSGAWAIDVFLDENARPYFAMAEVELPDGQESPSNILPVIEPLVVYPVPRERQTEFTNTRLHDIAYAEHLMRDILEGK